MTSLFIILEILLFCLGFTTLIYHSRIRFSEALCSGIVITLLILSFIFQVSFLIGKPEFSFIFEIILVFASVWLLKKRITYLKLFWEKICSFWQKNKIIASITSIAWVYLGLQSLILPVNGPDYNVYHLPRVLLFQQEKSLLLENITTLRQAIFPVGWNILNHAFLRFHTDYGLCIFAFLSYLAIACGTYALSRNITSPQISLITTLTIISFPQLVLQSTSTNTDIAIASVAVFCLLTIYRIWQTINVLDIVLLVLGMSFGISIKLTFIAFLIPFTLIYGILLLTKYPLHLWLNLIRQHWIIIILLAFPVAILSQIWLFIHNYYVWGGWSGPPDYVNYFKQGDGIKGGIANLIRYLSQSVDLMLPTDWISRKLLHIRLSTFFNEIYYKLIYPFFGDAGILKDSQHLPLPFKIQWRFVEGHSWFGICGFLLSIPSIIYVALTGKKFIKALGFTLLGFFFMTCYKVAWSPWRGRFFSLFFVCSGLCIAYSLEHLKLLFKDKINIVFKLIISLSFVTLFCTLSINESRPILWTSSGNKSQWIETIAKNNIWTKTSFGLKRNNNAVDPQLKQLINAPSRVALLAHHQTDIYSYLFTFPDVEFIPIHSSLYPQLRTINTFQAEFTNYKFINSLELDSTNFNYLLCLGIECNVEIPNISQKVIWRSNNIRELKSLVKLTPLMP